MSDFTETQRAAVGTVCAHGRPRRNKCAFVAALIETWKYNFTRDARAFTKNSHAARTGLPYASVSLADSGDCGGEAEAVKGDGKGQKEKTNTVCSSRKQKASD